MTTNKLYQFADRLELEIDILKIALIASKVKLGYDAELVEQAKRGATEALRQIQLVTHALRSLR